MEFDEILSRKTRGRLGFHVWFSEVEAVAQPGNVHRESITTNQAAVFLLSCT